MILKALTGNKNSTFIYLDVNNTVSNVGRDKLFSGSQLLWMFLPYAWLCKQEHWYVAHQGKTHRLFPLYLRLTDALTVSSKAASCCFENVSWRILKTRSAEAELGWVSKIFFTAAKPVLVWTTIAPFPLLSPSRSTFSPPIHCFSLYVIFFFSSWFWLAKLT